MLCVMRELTNMVIYCRIMILVSNVCVSHIVLSGFICLAHSYDRIHPFVMWKIGSNFIVLSYTTDLLNLILRATCVGVMLVPINLLCLTAVYQLLFIVTTVNNKAVALCNFLTVVSFIRPVYFVHNHHHHHHRHPSCVRPW